MWISDDLLFTLLFFDQTFLFALTVFFIVTLSDLESDYLNPPTCCKRLNQWVLPELIAVSFITLLTLLNLYLVLFALSAPITVWLASRFLLKPPGRIGLYDPLEIHNRQQLRSHMREAMGKLGYHLINLVLYLFLMISAFFTDESAAENTSLPHVTM